MDDPADIVAPLEGLKGRGIWNCGYSTNAGDDTRNLFVSVATNPDWVTDGQGWEDSSVCGGARFRLDTPPYHNDRIVIQRDGYSVMIRYESGQYAVDSATLGQFEQNVCRLV